LVAARQVAALECQATEPWLLQILNKARRSALISHRARDHLGLRKSLPEPFAFTKRGFESNMVPSRRPLCKKSKKGTDVTSDIHRVGIFLYQALKGKRKLPLFQV